MCHFTLNNFLKKNCIYILTTSYINVETEISPTIYLGFHHRQNKQKAEQRKCLI